MQTLLDAVYPKDKVAIQKHFELNLKIREIESLKSATAQQKKEIENLQKLRKTNDEILKKAMGENFEFLTDAKIDPEVAKIKLQKDKDLIEAEF